MKSLKYIFAAAALSCLGTACNESNWLEETPYDFYTPGNSYTTTAQFQQALNYLYDQVRGMRWKLGDQHMALICSDLASGGTDTNPVAKFNDYKTFITPYTYVSSSFWDISYAAIANANTIISRIDMENEVGEADKKVFKGQALFFRAYFYNFLANLYGGVPLILEEASEPRQDYVRASREETYDRARQDLEDAVLMLNDITAAKDGEVNIQAAKHLLTEVYISLGDYQKAIDAATDVIDDPNMELMDTRFGSRQGETANGESPYWDLFQLNNQNRSSGNKETIWALQYEYKNSGSPYSNELPRWLLPYYEGLNVPGKSGNDVKAFTLNTMEKGGRGIGTIRPTDHFLYEIWDAGDDRNSELLIKRDYQIDNPDAVDFGKWIMADHIYETLNTEQQTRQFYPPSFTLVRAFKLYTYQVSRACGLFGGDYLVLLHRRLLRYFFYEFEVGADEIRGMAEAHVVLVGREEDRTALLGEGPGVEDPLEGLPVVVVVVDPVARGVAVDAGVSEVVAAGPLADVGPFVPAPDLRVLVGDLEAVVLEAGEIVVEALDEDAGAARDGAVDALVAVDEERAVDAVVVEGIAVLDEGAGRRIGDEDAMALAAEGGDEVEVAVDVGHLRSPGALEGPVAHPEGVAGEGPVQEVVGFPAEEAGPAAGGVKVVAPVVAEDEGVGALAPADPREAAILGKVVVVGSALLLRGGGKEGKVFLRLGGGRKGGGRGKGGGRARPSVSPAGGEGEGGKAKGEGWLFHWICSFR